MRYLLQRVRTGEWLTRDFELSEGQRTRALSAPGGITGVIEPEWKKSIAPDGHPYLWKWGTFVYAEDDNGRITSAGIVEDVGYEEGKLTLTAPGFSRYAAGVPYTGIVKFIHQDPINVIAHHLWDHVQSTARGNIGLVLDSGIVTPEALWLGDNANPKAFAWWENTDCGGEFDSLAKQTPFDYNEIHTYTTAAHTAVSHRLQLGFPRLGRKRTDLRFAEGENIVSTVPVSGDGADYANELIGIGRGEGSVMVNGTMAIDDGRLRRPKILTDKTADKARIDALLKATMTKLLNDTDITAVTIKDDSNARLSVIEPGDDILIQATIPWLGAIRMWVRVLAITESDDNAHLAVLTTRRSDSFIYSGTTEIS